MAEALGRLRGPARAGELGQYVQRDSTAGLDGAAINGGEIGWLIDQYGGASLTNDQAAGLQLAIWACELDQTPSLSWGNVHRDHAGRDRRRLADAQKYLTRGGHEVGHGHLL